MKRKSSETIIFAQKKHVRFHYQHTKSKNKKCSSTSRKSSERRKQGIFVVEGVRETDMALKAGYEAKSLFFAHKPPIMKPLRF